MRRRSWVVRSGSKSRSARSSQSSGKEEVTGATSQKRKKKKLSPEAQDMKNAQWDEQYLEKKRITNTPCICGGTLEKHLFLACAENHNLKVQCTGSLGSTEIACGFKVISKKDLESIQRAIREKEARQNQYGSTSEETKKDGKSKEKIKTKECDCGGKSPNHKYYVRADDHTLGTRCMGPIRDTEFLVGYELITIKELEKINLEAEKRHNEETIDQTQGEGIPGNMEIGEIERNPNEGKKEKPEEVISEGSQKMFIDLIQYNLQEEKEKLERENRKKLQKEREKIQKEAQKPKSPSGTTNKKEEIIQAKETTRGKAIPRREITNTRKYENKTEREAAVLRNSDEYNLLLRDIRREAEIRTRRQGDALQKRYDGDIIEDLPYYVVADAYREALYTYWLNTLMEEKKEEIEFMETRAKIMCPPETPQKSSHKVNFPKIQEPKAPQITKDKKTLDKPGKKGAEQEVINIATSNRYQALSNMEHGAQESAEETGNIKRTRNQRRAANRKGRRAQEQAEETDRSNVSYEEPATTRPATQAQPEKAPKRGGKSTGQKLMPPIVITGILPFKKEARKEIEAADFLINKKICDTGRTRKIMNTLSTLIPCIALILLGNSSPDQVHLCITLLVIAVGFTGASFSGVFVNFLDISPNHSATTYGMSSQVSMLFSCAGPFVVNFFVDNEENPEQWKNFFYSTCGIYASTLLIYGLFGSGKVQKWNAEIQKDVV
ncbi:hypothetical protein JTB14_022150 [Gonioctena quinquepunctata]|nr:hypothetical protein JTB14_022150 [Gonioctena quinquepunctata]